MDIFGLYGDLNGSSVASEADERRIMRAFRQDGGRDSSVDSLENIEAVARVVADCGDDMETVLLSQSAEDPKLRYARLTYFMLLLGETV